MESTGRSEVHRRLRPFADAIADRGRDLDEMAFALSAVLQPDLDLIECLTSLDQLAAGCPTPTREGVIDHLFRSGPPDSGVFVGDRSDYHNWRNSCLDRVVASRRGMPITLAVVAIEVARRLGVRLVGIGLPGHFMVGDADDRGWFADPFHGRSGLEADDCRAILLEAGVSRWSDRFLDPTPNRLIIARMLNNLKLSCERSGDTVRLALVMQARQVMPEFAAEGDAARLALASLN